MSFAEFQIRLFAYQRVQEREWDKVRFVAFNAMRGSHLDPKKMPKTLQTFLKLKIDGNHNNTISEPFLLKQIKLIINLMLSRLIY